MTGVATTPHAAGMQIPLCSLPAHTVQPHWPEARCKAFLLFAPNKSSIVRPLHPYAHDVVMRMCSCLGVEDIDEGDELDDGAARGGCRCCAGLETLQDQASTLRQASVLKDQVSVSKLWCCWASRIRPQIIITRHLEQDFTCDLEGQGMANHATLG